MWHVSSKLWLAALLYSLLFAVSAWYLPNCKPVEVQNFEEGILVGALAWLFPITDVTLSSADVLQQLTCWFVGLSIFFGVIVGMVMLHDTTEKALGLLILVETMCVGSLITTHALSLSVGVGVLCGPLLLVVFFISGTVAATKESVVEFIERRRP